MANISNVRLSMGRRNATMEFGRITCNVNFSSSEVAHNLQFALYAAIFEIDDQRDTYHYNQNGAFSVSIERRAQGDRDDFIRWITSEVIRPNGNSTISIDRSLDFNVGNQERGNEEYEAVVWVVPEITDGKAWSNRVTINLG